VIHQLKVLTTHAIVLAGLAACAASPASQSTLRVLDDLPAPPPVNSHAGLFFAELFTGRVHIQSWRSVKGQSGTGVSMSPSAANVAVALLYLADGRLIGCVARDTQGKTHTWEDTWDREYIASGVSNNKKSYYDPITGLEAFWRRLENNGVWRLGLIGYWQNSWPRSMKDGCPDLDIPADYPINEKQTSTRYWTLLDQDPEAPIRHFQASHPSATSLLRGPSTEEQALAYLRGLDGQMFVLRDLPMVFSPDREELWLVAQDDGAIADVGRMKKDDTRDGWIRITWDLPTKDWTYLNLRLLAESVIQGRTSRRHPAFAFTEWLADGREVGLPVTGDTVAGLVFTTDGTVTARAADGVPITGSWWLEAGDINVSMADHGHRTWPWQEAADLTDYDGPRTLHDRKALP